eukprot:2270471-Amphidinium_carterae.1
MTPPVGPSAMQSGFPGGAASRVGHRDPTCSGSDFTAAFGGSGMAAFGHGASDDLAASGNISFSASADGRPTAGEFRKEGKQNAAAKIRDPRTWYSAFHCDTGV